MNRYVLMSGLTAVLSLSACDKPTVVNVPAPPAAVQGPAGPAGAPGTQGAQGEVGVQGTSGAQGDTGVQGNAGIKGDTGKSGDGTTVIVAPPASPAN